MVCLKGRGNLTILQVYSIVVVQCLPDKEQGIQGDIVQRYQLQLAAAEWSAGEYMVAEYCPMVCYGMLWYPMAVKAFEG